MINLSNDEFVTKTYVPFNNGQAGVATNVDLTIVKKQTGEKPNAPDYKLVFTDANGGTVNRGFWYVDEEALNKNAKALINQGKVMLHLWEVAKGKETQPPEFKSPVEMLDLTMSMLHENTRFKANVAVDYGTEKYHNSLLDVKFFVPFMELDVDETKLFLSKKAMLEPNVQDSPEILFTGGESESDSKW